MQSNEDRMNTLGGKEDCVGVLFANERSCVTELNGLVQRTGSWETEIKIVNR